MFHFLKADLDFKISAKLSPRIILANSGLDSNSAFAASKPFEVLINKSLETSGEPPKDPVNKSPGPAFLNNGLVPSVSKAINGLTNLRGLGGSLLFLLASCSLRLVSSF